MEGDEMYDQDGDGSRRRRAARALAGARQIGGAAWRPARAVTGGFGGRARGVASGVRRGLGRMPQAARTVPNPRLVAAGGGLLLVAVAGFLVGRLARRPPPWAESDYGPAPADWSAYGGDADGDDRFERAGPRSGSPGPGGLGRAAPRGGPPGPGGLGRPGARSGDVTRGTVRSPSATTPSASYEVPPGRTTARPTAPVDEPVIPAGREAGYPTEPLRRKPDHH